IILVAEGDEEGHALEIAKKVEAQIPGLNSRVTILGHIQRGGVPSCYDRVTASRLGAAAVEAIMNNKKDIMIGLENNQIVHVPIHKTVKMHKNVREELLQLTKKLL
ncbi:MAG: 6-phosphofructokinase, partial [bacterium]